MTLNDKNNQLEPNQVMIGRKEIFGLHHIQLWEVKEALVKAGKHSSEEVEAGIKSYDDILPYLYAIVAILKSHNEVEILCWERDCEKTRRIVNLLTETFNLKRPYKDGESVGFRSGKAIKYVIAKKTW